jgi:hypothetical protein
MIIGGQNPVIMTLMKVGRWCAAIGEAGPQVRMITA